MAAQSAATAAKTALSSNEREERNIRCHADARRHRGKNNHKKDGNDDNPQKIKTKVSAKFRGDRHFTRAEDEGRGDHTRTQYSEPISKLHAGAFDER